jgi:hypothetical protein
MDEMNTIKDGGGCSMERTWNYPPTHAGMEGAPFNPFAGVDWIRSSIGSCGSTHQHAHTCRHASRRRQDVVCRHELSRLEDLTC